MEGLYRFLRIDNRYRGPTGGDGADDRRCYLFVIIFSSQQKNASNLMFHVSSRKKMRRIQCSTSHFRHACVRLRLVSIVTAGTTDFDYCGLRSTHYARSMINDHHHAAMQSTSRQAGTNNSSDIILSIRRRSFECSPSDGPADRKYGIEGKRTFAIN